MPRTTIKDILSLDNPAGEVLVQGWVKTRRSSKSVSFVQINDGSTLRDLQVVFDDAHPDYAAANGLTTGCSVSIEGRVVESLGQGQKYEIQARSLRVVGEADPETYPLQKKRHTPEFLREIAHLRPRTNTFGAMARVRNAVAFAIHSFFQEQGFQYIQTRSSPPATPRAPAPCSGLRRWTWPTLRCGTARSIPRKTSSESRHF